MLSVPLAKDPASRCHKTHPITHMSLAWPPANSQAMMTREHMLVLRWQD